MKRVEAELRERPSSSEPGPESIASSPPSSSAVSISSPSVAPLAAVLRPPAIPSPSAPSSAGFSPVASSPLASPSLVSPSQFVPSQPLPALVSPQPPIALPSQFVPPSQTLPQPQPAPASAPTPAPAPAPAPPPAPATPPTPAPAPTSTPALAPAPHTSYHSTTVISLEERRGDLLQRSTPSSSSGTSTPAFRAPANAKGSMSAGPTTGSSHTHPSANTTQPTLKRKRSHEGDEKGAEADDDEILLVAGPSSSSLPARPVPVPLRTPSPTARPAPQQQPQSPHPEPQPQPPPPKAKPKLGLKHLPLLYDTRGNKMYCRSCARSFPATAAWADLVGHAQSAHAEACAGLEALRPAQVVEQSQRLQKSMGQRGSGGGGAVKGKK